MTQTLLKLNLNRDALFLDIDGTLLDIAPTPDSVVVPDELKSSLKELHSKLGGALAIISGRTIENIDKLFYPLRLPVAGIHGAEWRTTSQGKREQVYPFLSEKLRQTIKDMFSDNSSIRIEDKKYTIAVHYRQAPDMEKIIEEQLRLLISDSKENIILLSGKMVCEITCTEYNKGAIIERFMEKLPYAGRKAVYLGDDETDVSAISVCVKRGGIGMLIANGNYLSSPADVRKWLKEQV